MSYFFDTYALVEITKNNSNYDKFTSFPIITTTLNLSEYYFYLLSNLNKELANKVNELDKKVNELIIFWDTKDIEKWHSLKEIKSLFNEKLSFFSNMYNLYNIGLTHKCKKNILNKQLIVEKLFLGQT